MPDYQTRRRTDGPDHAILAFFRYSDHPAEWLDHLEPFASLARNIVNTIPAGHARSTALWKLLEAKDAVILALQYPGQGRGGK